MLASKILLSTWSFRIDLKPRFSVNSEYSYESQIFALALAARRWNDERASSRAPARRVRPLSLGAENLRLLALPAALTQPHTQVVPDINKLTINSNYNTVQW